MRGDGFKRAVYGFFVATGTRTEDVASAMGVSTRTFREHLKDPDKMTRREMSVLSGYVTKEIMHMICPWEGIA